MLSPFLKKLIFVRQFFITDGAIEILGEKQIMLPFDAVSHLQNDKTFAVMSTEMRKAMEYYAKKIGSDSGGMIKTVQDIYETMGLGKMQIIKLDNSKKEIIIRLMNAGVINPTLVSGVLCGLFSFVFNKDLTEKNIVVKKSAGYVDISIK